MEPEKQSASTTLLLEKEVEEKTEKKLVIEPTLSPRLQSLIDEKLKKVDEVKDVKINLNNTNILGKPRQVETPKVEEPEQETEIVEELVVETKDEEEYEVEPLYQKNTVQKEEVVLEEIPSVKPKKSKKFRLKLVLCVYALVLATFVGWTIGNAIAINNQAIMLETSQAEYSVKLSSYLIKINGLDGILDEEEKPNTLNPIETEIKVIPEEMVPPQEYSKQSNWFDNICNWLSNLFRR